MLWNVTRTVRCVTSDETHRESAATIRRPAATWWAAAVGTAASGAALVVMAILALTSIASGSASSSTRAATEAVMLLVLAACVAVVVVGLLRQRSLAKTPTLLWNGMLVPIGLALYDGGATSLGIGTVVVAVLTFVVALFLPRYDVEDRPDDPTV